jgi:hypothetical protein
VKDPTRSQCTVPSNKCLNNNIRFTHLTVASCGGSGRLRRIALNSSGPKSLLVLANVESSKHAAAADQEDQVDTSVIISPHKPRRNASHNNVSNAPLLLELSKKCALT